MFKKLSRVIADVGFRKNYTPLMISGNAIHQKRKSEDISYGEKYKRLGGTFPVHVIGIESVVTTLMVAASQTRRKLKL